MAVVWIIYYIVLRLFSDIRIQLVEIQDESQFKVGQNFREGTKYSRIKTNGKTST